MIFLFVFEEDFVKKKKDILALEFFGSHFTMWSRDAMKIIIIFLSERINFAVKRVTKTDLIAL